MSKKLFKFSDPEARPDLQSDVLPAEEAGARLKDEMRGLLRRDYSVDQLAVLSELAHGGETGARFDEMQADIDHEMIAPTTDLLKIMSEQTGLGMVDLKTLPRADHKLRNLITADQAKALRVVPCAVREDGTIVVAIADPSNPTIGDDLRLILGREVETVIADETDINERIEQYYGLGDETLEDVLENAVDKDESEDNVIYQDENMIDLSDLSTLAGQPAVIRLVNLLLLRAINDRASDIHIEPFPTFIRIRYRVDGVLKEIPAPPRNQLIAIISRIKVLATMRIDESRLPQDGRIKLSVEGREVDMRCSTIPTVHGESIVMRVLDKSMMMIGISNIGMLSEVLERFQKLIRLPNGIILVTGPTGSGKTTTLYAALAEIRDPGEKFITTEDPVEYEMDGIQQVNINEAVGLTYARCLRAILRQDPDRVLVGEVRDVETAQIAVQAALTGHLVMSTLHTNSASATVTRLLDMGVEPFLITSALIAIVGQRLVRSICQECKTPYEPQQEELREFGVTRDELREQGITLFRGEGCSECNHTGFHGRMGIYELLEITDEVRELILEQGTTDDILEVAARQGMMTMREDGWVKVCMGLTTLDEIVRQTPAGEMGGVMDAALDDDKVSMVADQEKPGQIETKSGSIQLPGPPRPKIDEETHLVEGEMGMPVPETGRAGDPEIDLEAEPESRPESEPRT